MSDEAIAAAVDEFYVDRAAWDAALARQKEIAPAIRALLIEWEECMLVLTREVYPEWGASLDSHRRHTHIAEKLVRGSRGARP